MIARTLMVQGTTSDAGKSLMVTALCRWLSRRGVRVAPFKAQNMALNSAVTPEGGEIGRAQAVQAAACGLAPHIDMNPVLLKPNSDIGAQIIIHGHAVANMNARGYHDYKRIAREAVLASHTRLCHAHDVIVAEGAGSPAEINLRAGDIANMGFAEAVDCPVILIADIDRGGVFAHIVGTLALLSESERARVAGFVINRFRGDISLLQPGLDWLEQETGKPVIGVLPYLRGLFLDAEDAIVAHQPEKAANALRVVVPVLPRISNHTDFDALRLHRRVDLRFVALSDEMPAADLIILPGSKSVRADLTALRAAGWETRLARHLRYGGKVLGICGGMQMLGAAIHDPDGIEGTSGSARGLGLLDFETTLAAEKTLCNREGVLAWCGAEVRGYEIHAGVSNGPALSMPALMLSPVLPLSHWERTELRVFGGSQSAGILGEGHNLSRDCIPSPHSLPVGEGMERRICFKAGQEAAFPDGAISADNQIMATYLHGLFDAPAACDALLAWAGLASGESATIDIAARRESEFDRLADMVSEHLNTTLIAQLCGVVP